MNIAIDPTDLAEALRVVVREELQRLRDEARAQEWFSLESASAYVDATPQALRAAEKRGQLVGHRTATGRPRFRREDLDTFVVAGDSP